ncbi:major facilitator superfamily domain-containing protein [Aspergillus carlsbadensis]|nr:major facilitator superfamily domain-containing protein [Aspergillus carlsbadensis]
MSPSTTADQTTEETPLLPSLEDHQLQPLSRRQLLTVIPALSLVHFTSFLDQTAISTALPAIAQGLHIGSSISWVGASFMITSTSIQLINGRLSDIFGRKTCLVGALAIMAIGNVASGFSRTPLELFATRAVSGVGAGALNALVQIAVSDYTTLEQRGYYFGLMGIATALGNGLGPVVGGVLTERAGWRWAFWVIGPLAAVAIAFLVLVLPPSRNSSRGGVWKKLRLVDWFGVVTSMAATILILVPLSRGGSALSWTSPAVIMMLSAGVFLYGVFLIAEWRFVKLPILPLHLFRSSPSTNILLATNLIIGWVFWSNLFYIPLYFQIIRGWSPSTAGSMILPMVISHGATSGLTGILVAALGCYMPIIHGGTALWMVGAVVKACFGPRTKVWVVFLAGVLEGVGVGCSLQPGSQTADRAVITGLRNFIRDIGVSGTILNNILYTGLKAHFAPELISQLASASAPALQNLNLSDDERRLISAVYMRGLSAVFMSPRSTSESPYPSPSPYPYPYPLEPPNVETGRISPNSNSSPRSPPTDTAFPTPTAVPTPTPLPLSPSSPLSPPSSPPGPEPGAT